MNHQLSLLEAAMDSMNSKVTTKKRMSIYLLTMNMIQKNFPEADAINIGDRYRKLNVSWLYSWNSWIFKT